MHTMSLPSPHHFSLLKQRRHFLPICHSIGTNTSLRLHHSPGIISIHHDASQTTNRCAASLGRNFQCREFSSGNNGTKEGIPAADSHLQTARQDHNNNNTISPISIHQAREIVKNYLLKEFQHDASTSDTVTHQQLHHQAPSFKNSTVAGNISSISPAHYRNLMRMTSLQKPMLQRIIYSLLEPKGRITEEKKQHIRDFLERKVEMQTNLVNDTDAEGAEKRSASSDQTTRHSLITPEEYIQLAKETQLSRRQIYALVARMEDQLGSISEKDRKYVREWINGKFPIIPNQQRSTYLLQNVTKEEYQHLQNQTGLAKRQIYYVLNDFLDPSGIVTKQKRKRVREWYNKQLARVHYTAMRPTLKQLTELQQEVELSLKQIRQIISSQRIRISPWKKALIRKAVMDFDRVQQSGSSSLISNRDEEASKLIIRLSKETNLKPASVRRFIRTIHLRRTISEEHRELVREFLLSNNFQKPSEEQFSHLLGQTKLYPSQLKALVDRLLSRMQRVTLSQWREIQHWMNEQSNENQQELRKGIKSHRVSTTLKEALKVLSNRINIPSHLILFTAKYIDNPHGIITDANRKLIQENLSKRMQEIADLRGSFTASDVFLPEQLQHLSRETNLSQHQIVSHVQTLMDPPRKITPLKRVLIRDFVDKHGYTGTKSLTNEHLAHLKSETNLSTQQIRRIISQIYANTSSDTLQQATITDEKKQQIEAFFLANHSSMSTTQMATTLSEQTSSPKEQVRNLLRELRYAKGSTPITSEKKEAILNWLRINNYQKPTKEQFADLLQRTNVSRRQLHNMLQYHIKKHSATQ